MIRSTLAGQAGAAVVLAALLAALGRAQQSARDLQPHRSVWSTLSQHELVVPANQDVKYKWLKTYGQLVTNNRKRHSLKTGLTDT